MIQTERVDWSIIKNSIDINSAKLIYAENTSYYLIVISKGILKTETIISKTTPRNVDQVDFEDNYKALADFTDNINTININGIVPVNGQIPVNATVNVSASAQTISNKIKVDFSINSQTLPTNSATILDYYTYLGSGTFYGFVTYFSSDDVIVELEVDGNIVFSFKLKDLKDFKEEDDVIPWFKYEEKQLSYEPSFGISYATSIKLKAKASSSSSSKKMKQYLVNIEKVT